jgi:hypothetical protein
LHEQNYQDVTVDTNCPLNLVIITINRRLFYLELNSTYSIHTEYMIFYRRIGNIGNIPPNMLDFGISRQSIAERVIQQQQELLKNISISNLTPPFTPLNIYDTDLMVKQEQERKILARANKIEDFDNIGFSNF